MPVRRNYNTKDVEMLLAAYTILEVAIANKTFLQAKRQKWADPFFEDLKTKIDSALQTYLGIDSAKALRQSTAAIKIIQNDALRDLAEMKVQLKEDLKGQKDLRNELLRQLGFTNLHKNAQQRNQESLIDLLRQFNLNLTTTVRTQIISKTGVSEALLNSIVGYADYLIKANVNQEMDKGTRKAITAEARTAFNEIYDAVISVSRIASTYYKNNSAVKAQFSFNKIVKGMNNSAKSSPRIEPQGGQ